MLKLYLIRHGLTEWNRTNRFQGSTDIELCNEGLEQAVKIAERMSVESIDAVYSSDLSRAYATAQHIASHHQLDVIKVPEVREIHFGQWEGMTRSEIEKQKEYDFSAWHESPHTATFPGEGTLSAVQKRIMVGLNKIIEESKEKNIVLVSHGGSIKLSILSLLDLDLSFYNKFWLGNTSLSIIELNKEKYILSLLNDMSHLSNI